jgi:tetratricopeptide (TPR) repeat protein
MTHILALPRAMTVAATLAAAAFALSAGPALADLYGIDPNGTYFYEPDFPPGDLRAAVAGYTRAINEMEKHGEAIAGNSLLLRHYAGRMTANFELGHSNAALEDLLTIYENTTRTFTELSYDDWKVAVELAGYGLQNRTEKKFELHRLRATVYERLDDRAAAVSDLTASIEVAPTDGDKAWATIARSYDQEALSNFDPALEDASAAIALIPTEGSFFSQRSSLYEKRGELELAVADLNQALSFRQPGYQGYDYELATRAKLLRKLGRLDEAYADLSDMVARFPSDRTSLGERMLVLFEQGKEREAEADRRVLERLDKAYLDGLAEEIAAVRPADTVSDPLDRNSLLGVWNVAEVLIRVPVMHLVGKADQSADESYAKLSKLVRQSQEQAGIQPALGLDPFPAFSGSKTEQLRQALDYLTRERGVVSEFMMRESGNQAKEFFAVAVAAASHLLFMLNRLGSPRLNHALARDVAESGPNSGLPEEIWKPFSENAATLNPEDAIKAWEEMTNQMQAFLNKS